MTAGEDCPRCGARLGESGCLKCYWQPTPEAPAKNALNVCERCGGASPSTTPFHPDLDDGAAPEDRGVRLCPACWIPALRRRAERDPISAEARAALRHELYRHLDMIAARVNVKATRLTERGSQEDMVDRSVKAASELERYRRHLQGQRE